MHLACIYSSHPDTKKADFGTLEGGLDLGITGILTFFGHSGQTGHFKLGFCGQFKLLITKGIILWFLFG